jgi:hypothetical protein
MQLERTASFKQGFAKLPAALKRRAEKALRLLVQNLRHPSLRAKKIYHQKLQRWVWQARVNGGWRFYFDIEGDIMYLLAIGPHPK